MEYIFVPHVPTKRQSEFKGTILLLAEPDCACAKNANYN
jgi:hypothetical protein